MAQPIQVGLGLISYQRIFDLVKLNILPSYIVSTQLGPPQGEERA